MKGTTFSEALLFLKKNIQQPLVNASFVPSSPAAARAMLQSIDFSRIKTVVELGPGTGPYTQAILERASSGCKVVVIEIDPDYVKLLREKFGERIILVHAGAENFEKILRKHGIEKPDLIISALPFLPLEQRKILVESIRKFTQAGSIFRFEMIVRWWGFKAYGSLPIRKIARVWRCIPPMWIYGIN